jgi:hypothetical protein
MHPDWYQNAEADAQAGTIFNITECSPWNSFFSHHERSNTRPKSRVAGHALPREEPAGTAGKAHSQQMSRPAGTKEQVLHLLTEHTGPVDEPAPRL